MSLRQRALRSATWAVAGGNASQLLAFVLFMIISRMVGPAAFGTMAVAITLVELCRAVFSEAVVGNLIARGRYSDDDFNAGLALCMASALVLVAALCALAPVLALWFRSPDLRFVLPQVSFLLVFYGATRLQEAYLMLELRFDSLAYRSIAAAFAGGGAGIAAAQFGFGVEALVVQQWVAALISLLLLWRACPWRPNFRFDRDTLICLSRSSLALAPAGLLNNLCLLVDGLVVAAFSGPAAAGVYNLGKRFRLALQLGLSTALTRVSLPTFAQVQKDLSRLAGTIEQAMRLTMVIAFPVFLGVAAVAPEVIGIFLGAEWEGAAAPLAILLVAGAVAIVSSYCDNALLILDRRRWIVGLRVFMLVILGAGLLIVGRHGPVAVAAVTLAATLAHSVAAWFATARAAPLKLRVYLATVLVPFALSLAMLALLTALRDARFVADLAAWVRLAVFVTLGAAFYLGSAWLFARPAVRGVVSAARTVLAI